MCGTPILGKLVENINIYLARADKVVEISVQIFLGRCVNTIHFLSEFGY